MKKSMLSDLPGRARGLLAGRARALVDDNTGLRSEGSPAVGPAERAGQAMTLRYYLLASLVFVLAAGLAVGAARFSAVAIEAAMEREVLVALNEGGTDWADVVTDGLLVTLSGEAPNEAARFRALSLTNTVVDADRVIDTITVAPGREIAPPQFLLEVLRNGLDVSIIGLVPRAYGVDDMIAGIEGISADLVLTNMMETADHPVPPGWEQSVDYAIKALAILPASKVSVGVDTVSIAALAESEAQRDSLRAQLNRMRPPEVIVALDISAPRPVITPFTLRFTIDAEGARFDACAVETREGYNIIRRAGRMAGATGAFDCTLGLGSPSPRWPQVAERAIAALHDLGEGAVTITNTDVSLVVPNTIEPARFDQVVGLLENTLPAAFTLQSLRLAPELDTEARDNTAEFVVALGESGMVLLRGRLADERQRDAVAALARAEFGPNAVQIAARLDPDLPEGWALRALLAVEALGHLKHGEAQVRADSLGVRGVTGDTTTRDRVARLLSDKLGPGANFQLNIRYDERLDPVAMAPTPARCERWIAEIIEQDGQITFAPGSATITDDTAPIVDAIAVVIGQCGRLEMEVGGHTDSQGGLEGNLRLSQRRADAVINALMARGALVSEFVSKGFGPEFPVADNTTAAGREANRRIEFRLTGASAEAAQAEAAQAASVAEAGDASTAGEAADVATGNEPEVGGATAADSEGDAVAKSAEMDESEIEIVVTIGAGDSLRPRSRPAQTE